MPESKNKKKQSRVIAFPADETQTSPDISEELRRDIVNDVTRQFMSEGGTLSDLMSMVAERLGVSIPDPLEVLRKKEEQTYRETFKKILNARGKKENYYIFKIIYMRNPSSRKPSRTIAFVGDFSLDEFCQTALESFDFIVDHLYALYPRRIEGVPDSGQFSKYGIFHEAFADDEPFKTKKLKDVKLNRVRWDLYPRWNMVFDFGDGHTFHVDYKKVMKPDDFEIKYHTSNRSLIVRETGEPPEQDVKWLLDDDTT